MKKISTSLLTISLILVSGGLLFAQSTGTPGTATWSLTKNDTTSASVTGNVMADSENVVGLVPAYETPANPPTWWSTQLATTKDTTIQKVKPDANTSGSTLYYWPVETTYNPKRYVQFSFGPKSGNDMIVDSLAMWIGAKGYTQFIGAIYYSTHSDFSNPVQLAGDKDTLSEHPSLVDTSFVGVNKLIGMQLTIPDGQKLYVRVYPYAPYGKNSTSKYMYIGNVRAYARTTQSTTTSNMASATWTLSKADTTSDMVTGNVTATAEDTTGLQIGYDNSYTTNYVQKFKPNASTSDATNGTGSWPQETQYNTSRYIQFSVGPTSGYDLTVDSLAMQIGDKGVKGMYADVYYSTSSDFSNAMPLAQKDSLAENGTIDTTLVGTGPSGLGIAVNNGQTMYVRVYPWLHVSSTSTSKYMYLGNVIIYGKTNVATAIQKGVQLPSGYKLDQNYPNPFNPTTNIAFQIPQKSMVTLKVYNVLGQEVETLVQGVRAAGHYIVRFNGAGLASGIYIYRLQAGNFTQSKELIMLK